MRLGAGVSKNLAEVEMVCHRVAIIRDGRIIACETLAALKRKRLRRMEITLAVPMKEIEIPNARRVSPSEDRHAFMISGDLAPILKAVSHLPVSDMVLARGRHHNQRTLDIGPAIFFSIQTCPVAGP